MTKAKVSGARLLLVEDNGVDAQVMLCRLRGHGFTVDLAITGEEAIKLSRQNDYYAYVLDFMLPDMTAAGLVRSLKANGDNTPFIMVAGTGNEQDAVTMMKLGAMDYIAKDEDYTEMLGRILFRQLRCDRARKIRQRISSVLMCCSLALVLYAFNLANTNWNNMRIQQHRLQVLSDLAAGTGESLVVLDGKGRICEWSDSMAALTGWTWEEVKGSLPDFLLPVDPDNDSMQTFRQALIGEVGHVSTVDCWIFHKDGSLHPVHVHASTFQNHTGAYSMTLFADPTQLQRFPVQDKPAADSRVEPDPVPGTSRLFR